jgi:hypothetical protein
LPGDFADATCASQFKARSVWLVADAPVFSGGGTDWSCWRVTTQSGHAVRSPTVFETTTVNPAPESAARASEYFCPTTLGDEAA